LDGAKGKSVRYIPVYDKPTDKLPTGGYNTIQEKITRFSYKLGDRCHATGNTTLPDDAKLKIVADDLWGHKESDRDWFNNTITLNSATHVKLVQVNCGGNFSKWVKTNYKINGLTKMNSSRTKADDKSFCLNLDFEYYKLQEQLNYRFNCTNAQLRIVLGDEKETFLFVPIRVDGISNIYIQPKKAKLCGFMCVLMIGAGGIFAVLLIIFLIVYFRNKNKKDSYEDSLSKPLTSGQSPYYELPQV